MTLMDISDIIDSGQNKLRTSGSGVFCTDKNLHYTCFG